MTLKEIIADLDNLDDDYSVYAREPWTADSLAMIAREPDDDEPFGYDGPWVPDEGRALGLEYCLDIDTARQAIEAIEQHFGRELSLEEKCHHVIHYATYDAYDFEPDNPEKRIGGYADWGWAGRKRSK